MTATLTKLFNGSDPDAAPKDVAVVREWVTEFLGLPSEDVGRSGPVCPFIRSAVTRESLWFGRIDGASPDVEASRDYLRFVRKELSAAPLMSDPDVLLTAAIISLPDVLDYPIIDGLQGELKDEFVETGWMIGQFYPGCKEPGLWNPDFRPLDSPIPMIAIRRMVASDFPFLRRKAEWIETYLRQFAPNLPATVRHNLANGSGT